MKLIVSMLAIVMCLGLFAAAEPTTSPSTAPAASNTLCPVSKEPVDDRVATYEYKGQVIGFCCEDCVKAFKANPEKYIANMK